MKYTIIPSKRFLKDIKRCEKRGYDMRLLKDAVALLALSGQYNGCWECHLKPDWLLIWEQNDTELTLLFTGTGTHSDLF